MLGILNANDYHSIANLDLKFAKFNVRICLCQGNFAPGHLETKMKDTYLVYIGQSKEPGEEACLTVGITKNAERRQYLKHMVVQHVLPAKSKRHALAIEREGQIFFDKHYPKAFVRWSPVDLPESPNRGFDWWITSRAVTHYEYLEVFELMRNRQLNWDKSVKLPRRKK
jgi:hypothetical protein